MADRTKFVLDLGVELPSTTGRFMNQLARIAIALIAAWLTAVSLAVAMGGFSNTGILVFLVAVPSTVAIAVYLFLGRKARID